MERDFYTDEFEDLIKTKADQYRMYPSDKVWKGIKRSLHSNKRKYWFGFALLITGLSYFGIDQLIVSPPQIAKPTPSTATPEKTPAKIVPFAEVSPHSSNESKPNSNLSQKLNEATGTQEAPGNSTAQRSELVPVEVMPDALRLSVMDDSQGTESLEPALIIGIDRSVESLNDILRPSFPLIITTKPGTQEE